MRDARRIGAKISAVPGKILAPPPQEERKATRGNFQVGAMASEYVARLPRILVDDDCLWKRAEKNALEPGMAFDDTGVGACDEVGKARLLVK